MFVGMVLANFKCRECGEEDVRWVQIKPGLAEAQCHKCGSNDVYKVEREVKD